MGKIQRLIACMIFFLDVHQQLLTTDAQTIVANEALSSPSSITAMKSSAVWLHWNYTFVDSNQLLFERQHWIIKETDLNRVTVVAKKIGLNGQMTIESSLPSTMMGRIIAFPNNDTLRIKNLNYNDSLWQFKSTGFIKFLLGSAVFTLHLKPEVINLTVQGVPEYRLFPPEKLEVREDGVLSIVTHFDGNPKPIAEVQWSDSSTKQAMTVHKEYPYIYTTQYSMNKTSPKYCGKSLTMRVQNSVGKAGDFNVAVTVLLNFDNPNLRAGKPNQSCVEVQWQMKESGLCYVTYTVSFKDKNETVVYTNSEINKPGTTKCGIPSNIDIDQVELTMSSTKRSKTFIALVSEKPLQKPTKAPQTKGVKYGAIIGGTIGGLLAVILLVLLVIYFMKRGKWSPGSQDKSRFLQLNAKSANPTTVDQPKKAQISEP